MSQSTWSVRFLKLLKSTLIFIAIFIFISGGLFFLDNFFRIKQIQIEGPDNSELFGTENLMNKNLILVDTEEAAKSIKNKNAGVSAAKVEKKFPSTLFVKVNLYRTVGKLVVAGGFFTLSEDGRIISKEKKGDSNLPNINYYEKLNYYSYSAGQYVDYKDIKDGLTYISTLKNIGLQVVSLDIKDVDMLLCNVGEKKIIFTSLKDRKVQEYQIRQLVKTFKIQGKDFKSIDLRYDKAIVQY